MESVIFCETPTLGIRRVSLERTVLKRRRLTVETPYGSIRCKVAELPDGSVRIAPEYEDCRAAARTFGAPCARSWLPRVKPCRSSARIWRSSARSLRSNAGNTLVKRKGNRIRVRGHGGHAQGPRVQWARSLQKGRS